MKTLMIDRIDSTYAICKDARVKSQKEKNQRLFGIQLSELPSGASVGDTIVVDDDTGTLTLAQSKAPLADENE